MATTLDPPDQKRRKVSYHRILTWCDPSVCADTTDADVLLRRSHCLWLHDEYLATAS